MSKRSRRSKPDLVDRLCDAIKELTAGRASRSYALQWVALSDVAQHLGISDDEAEQAVALALERHRIITDGGSPQHRLPYTKPATGSRAGWVHGVRTADRKACTRAQASRRSYYCDRPSVTISFNLATSSGTLSASRAPATMGRQRRMSFRVEPLSLA
jgi:hypothetical protein